MKTIQLYGKVYNIRVGKTGYYLGTPFERVTHRYFGDSGTAREELAGTPILLALAKMCRNECATMPEVPLDVYRKIASVWT